MKKNKKIFKKSWTERKNVVILTILSIYVLLNSMCLAIENNGKSAVEVVSGKGETTKMLKKMALLEKKIEKLKQDNLTQGRDLKVQREVNVKLKEEFVEIRNRYKERVRELTIISHGVAGALTRKGVEKVGSREARIDKVLNSFSRKIYRYVLESLTFISDAKSLSATETVSTDSRALLTLQAESLETQAGEILSISGIIKNDVSLNKTQVLKVDQSSNLIVLAGGFNQGLREGVKFKINLNKEKHVTILVIAVRTYVSAAIIIEGDVKDVTVGDVANGIIENS